MTLRSRLLLAAALFVVVLAAVGYSLIRTVETSQLHQADNQLTSTLPISLGVAQNAPIPGANHPTPPDGNVGFSDTYLALIVDGHRQTIASPQSANGATPQTPRPQILSGTSVPAATGGLRIATVGSLHGHGRWRAVLLQTPNRTQILAAIYLGPLDATAAQLRSAVLAAGGIVALILLVSGFWLERLGLRPIAEMKDVAVAIAAGDRSRRATPTPASRSEAAQLARALNSMLDRQNAIEDQLRQFLADVSHELRTPTSVIFGLSQLWRQGDLRDGNALADAMRRIGRESTRMRGLVEELMLLARLDVGTPIQSQPVDIGDLARDVLADAESTHPSRHLQADIADHVIADGDPTALRRVVSNLVTNALIHTPSTSSIIVRVNKTTNSALLEVTDTGPGMDPAESAHAFDRFWRGETSRTRPGSGLGLSIAQSVVNAHHGRIHLKTTPEQGTTVKVELPPPQTAAPSSANQQPATQPNVRE
jgi:two-component system, OmpR family, sensor kinase